MGENKFYDGTKLMSMKDIMVIHQKYSYVLQTVLLEKPHSLIGTHLKNG